MGVIAVWKLYGENQPPIEQTLRFAESVRRAFMHVSRCSFGEDSIPFTFSGHGSHGASENQHRHAFFLPLDSQNSGYIDRMVLWATCLTDRERLVLTRVSRIFQPGRPPVLLLLESMGDEKSCEQGVRICAQSTTWRSLTPYLHPWFLKRRFGIAEQITRECLARSMPVPVDIRNLDHVKAGGRRLLPMQFQRHRKQTSGLQADRYGRFIELTFPTPIRGPLCLGFGCHFGLGLFSPCDPSNISTGTAMGLLKETEAKSATSLV